MQAALGSVNSPIDKFVCSYPRISKFQVKIGRILLRSQLWWLVIVQRDFGPDGDQETPRLRSQSVEGRTTDDMYPPLLRGAFSDGGASGSSSPRSNTSIY